MFIITLPVFLVICMLIVIFTGTPVFFTQKRFGLNGKRFNLLKFRTMIRGATKHKWRYLHLNEADGPVFKIRLDPRFTKIGHFLANTGLDELPQLINVIKGDMSLVGPRPLPVSEAKKLNPNDQQRHLIKPGVTSPWVIAGAHSLSFATWMQLDRNYLKSGSLPEDVSVLLRTFILSLNQLVRPH
jgi:lipopolysaccharide/colanic/teichoic acid biosynthesis glycosyltransferase